MVGTSLSSHTFGTRSCRWKRSELWRRRVAVDLGCLLSEIPWEEVLYLPHSYCPYKHGGYTQPIPQGHNCIGGVGLKSVFSHLYGSDAFSAHHDLRGLSISGVIIVARPGVLASQFRVT